jgi:hypothetical protein
VTSLNQRAGTGHAGHASADDGEVEVVLHALSSRMVDSLQCTSLRVPDHG